MLLIPALRKTTKSTTTSSRIFAKPVLYKDINGAVQKAVPEKTQADTKYCANLWEQWVKHQAETTGDVIPHLVDIKV